jgi:hypothetical protein
MKNWNPCRGLKSSEWLSLAGGPPTNFQLPAIRVTISIYIVYPPAFDLPWKTGGMHSSNFPQAQGQAQPPSDKNSLSSSPPAFPHWFSLRQCASLLLHFLDRERSVSVSPSLIANKERYHPWPGGDCFQKMDILTVSSRSISVSPCARFRLVLVYDHRPPQIVPPSRP